MSKLLKTLPSTPTRSEADGPVIIPFPSHLVEPDDKEREFVEQLGEIAQAVADRGFIELPDGNILTVDL